MSEQTQTREPGTDPAPAAPPRGSSRSSWGSSPRWAVVSLAAAVALLAGLVLGSLLPGAPETPGADSVDVGFAQDMTVHHRQAVEMASWERDRTADPALRQLAFDIETTQNQQVGRMQGWLGLWDQPAIGSGGHMAWMGDAAHAGHSMPAGSMPAGSTSVASMPGMASSEDLRRMRQTPEPALDTVFLQLMLRHHEGGVSMLEYGRDHAETVEVRNLATQMLSAQSSEAELMKRQLARRGAQPLPL